LTATFRDAGGRRVACLAAAILLSGCTTTHVLGPIKDEGVRADVDAIAARGDATVRVRPVPGTRPPPFGERVTGIAEPGLIIEPTRGQPLLVAREQVASLSRYDHPRGAGDGAIGGGIAGFAVGFLVLALMTNAGSSACTDGCGDRPDPVANGLGAGLILGGITAILGAALGLLGGHEERFEITP
jgi:hypothetical protein